MRRKDGGMDGGMDPRKDPRKDREPGRLFRFVMLSAADGVAAGWVLLLLLLRLDIGGLGARVHGAPDGALALAMLAGGFAVTFSYLGIVWGVMARLPEED